METPPAVVLVRTQEEGNVGATARAMANMGLIELVLVAPRVEIGATARAFAVGAGHLLDRARVAPSLTEALAPFRRVVGTTSARGRDEPEPHLHPRQLAARLAEDPTGTPTALVFGPEASGLTNDELARCSPVVRVPCAPEQPTLNLSQAVLILAYELYASRRQGRPAEADEAEPAASSGEIEGLFTQLTPLLERVGFSRDDTFRTVLRDLRRLAVRGGPTSREVQILRGICRRTEHALARRRGDAGAAGGESD